MARYGMHTCNTSTQETEAGRDQHVPGQPELHNESPFQEGREDGGNKLFIVKQTNRSEPINKEKRKTPKNNDYVCY